MQVQDIIRLGMMTVPATADLRTASRKLLKLTDDAGSNRHQADEPPQYSVIPVVKELEVIGSLTIRDVARNYHQLIDEASTESELRETWNSDDSRIEFDI